MDSESKLKNRDGNLNDGDCRFLRDRLHCYIDCELDSSTSHFISSHLKVCMSCSKEKERLEAERLDLLERMVDPPKLNNHFASKIRQAIEEKESIREQKHRLLTLRFIFGMAAGILLGSTIVTMAFLTILNPDNAGFQNRVATKTLPAEVLQTEILPAEVVPAAAVPVLSAGNKATDQIVRDFSESSAPNPNLAPVQNTAAHPEIQLKAQKINKSAVIGASQITTTQRTVTYPAVTSEHPPGHSKDAEEILDEHSPCTKDINEDGDFNVMDYAHAVAFHFGDGAPNISTPDCEQVLCY